MSKNKNATVISSTEGLQKFPLNLEYKLTLSDKELKDKNKVFSEITVSYISSSVEMKYKDGLEGQLRRLWGRIQRKMDEAIENKTYSIELENAEKDFIKNSFKEAKFPAALAKHITFFEDAFIELL